MVGWTAALVAALAVEACAQDGMVHLFEGFPRFCVMACRTLGRANVDVPGGLRIGVAFHTVQRRGQHRVVHFFERFPGFRVMAHGALRSLYIDMP
jgi:hypothetical protein